jgi:asparaginyl-tRNA synthetase
VPKKDGQIDYAQDFFDRPAYLTVSGQLEAEIFACALGKVYTFGPTFRAENSNTSRHLAEFWMVEPEMAFFDLPTTWTWPSGSSNASSATCWRTARGHAVLQRADRQDGHRDARADHRHATSSAALHRGRRDSRTPAAKTFEFPVAWGRDLQSEHERYLTEQHFQAPVILYDYPRTIKPFYMYVNDDGRTVRAMDVLVPKVGEIIGGSQRESGSTCSSSACASGLDPADYWWYLDLRRYGTVPHAGFGLGFERLCSSSPAWPTSAT